MREKEVRINQLFLQHNLGKIAQNSSVAIILFKIGFVEKKESTCSTIRVAWIFLATVSVLNLSKQGVKSLPSWFALMQGCLVGWLLPD